MGCALIGCGKHLPALVVENDDLIKLVDTSDEWITTRTGIHRRRIAVDETNVDLAEGAARQALGWDAGGYCEDGPIDAASIDLIVYSTCTPDVLVPSCAALLRRRLGLPNAVAFDINAACSGFVYAMSVVDAFMAGCAPAAPGSASRNRVRRALVVGSERLTRITDWTDRATCVLFGDGGGAAVVEWRDDEPGVLASFITNDDDAANALTCPTSFDAPQPFTKQGISREAMAAGDPGNARIEAELGVTELIDAGRPHQALYMHGQKVFKFAADAMGNAIDKVCELSGTDVDDVKLIVPHQANERIIKFAAKRCGLPLERFQVSIGERGNASSACVPMALSDAYESGRIQKGDKVILVAFGGGFTSGAVLYQA